MLSAKAQGQAGDESVEGVKMDHRIALAYERNLDPDKRKQLGQYFSGVRLGKLLAHIALREDFRTTLDPMAGHGDLLVAAWQSAAERGIPIERLDGIEIDGATAEACRRRLAAQTAGAGNLESCVLTADAFDPASPDALPARGYDLVIANPPYVRYQARRRYGGAKADPVREGLHQIVMSHCAEDEKPVWQVLSRSYSGLADLSVPAWMLAASMVRPGGCLAMVVPATWRSRDYADVIRYLLLRCFAMKAIVADTQPGWFSDALVRTHLVIARRLPPSEARRPLGLRKDWPEAQWIRIAPDAANEHSLVGATHGDRCPEAAFVASIDQDAPAAKSGIEVGSFDLHREWASLSARACRRRWYTQLEEVAHGMPLFGVAQPPHSAIVPNAIQDVLPASADATTFVPLETAGIKVGQGLRTGCNAFFYVTAADSAGDSEVRAVASSTFGDAEVRVPEDALRPALRRQAETRLVERGELPPSRILDLRAWVLPEDAPIVAAAKSAYARRGVKPPRVMPPGLADHVRCAAVVSSDKSGNSKPIPELSAVRTNVRLPARENVPPRFWYMLPDFTLRHLPEAFAPRVNQRTPWVECNLDAPLLIDANFSTFWAPNGNWSRFALKALLNSVWCRAYMEVAGTPLGGGALKLEATHLRQMLVPPVSLEGRAALDAAGRKLSRNSASVQAQIDHVVLQSLFPHRARKADILNLATRLAQRTQSLCEARQRRAS